MVVWLPRAERDLDTIYRTTAEENPTAALDLLTRIDEAVRRLEAFPNSGRPRRVLGTRELVVDDTLFIMPCRVRGGAMHILRAWFSSVATAVLRLGGLYTHPTAFLNVYAAASSCFSSNPYSFKQFSHIILRLDFLLTPGSSRNVLRPLGNGPSAWG